jgi:hypothetical protein
MSCQPKFETQVSLACILELVTLARAGKQQEALKRGLWLAGCGMEILKPSETPVGIMETTEQDVLLTQLETAVTDRIVLTLSSENDVRPEDWTIFIPIIIELLKRWLKK